MSITQKGYVRAKIQTTLGTPDVTSMTFIEPQDSAIPALDLGKYETSGLDGTKNPTPRVSTVTEQSLSMATLALGCSTVGAVAAVAVPAAEMIPLMNSLFGAAPTGSFSDTVDASSANDNIGVTTFPADPLEVGEGILVHTGSKYQYRVVTVASDPDYTLNQATVNEATGSPAAPTTAQAFYTGANWGFAEADTYPFLTIDRETETDRFILEGCQVQSMALAVPANGDPLTMTWALDANTHDRATALGSATYVQAARGSEILGVDSPMTIGANSYCGRDFSFTFANGAARHTTNCGVNGFSGHKILAPMVEFTFTLYAGAGVGEASKNLKATLEAGTHDLTFQFGRAQGSAIGIRIPAGDLKVTHAEVDGQDVLNVSGYGSGADLCNVTLF